MANSEDREVVLLDLDNPAHKGVVIGRLDGQVVFVHGGLPGESGVAVELEPQKTSKSARGFRTGRVKTVKQPSPHRVENICEAASAGAGCCDLDFVDAAGSLDFKTAVVLDQMTRIAKTEFSDDQLSRLLQKTSLWPQSNYRTRARLGVDNHGRAGLRLSRSREILPLENGECAQWIPGLVDGLTSQRFTPGSEVIVGMGQDGQRSAVEIAKRGRRRQIAVVLGDGFLNQSHLGVSWRLPVTAFWQAHMGAATYYANWVSEVIPRGDGVAWDLYGGAGALATALASKVDQIDIVEHASAAMRAGQQAFADVTTDSEVEEKRADIRFVEGDVAKNLDSLRTSPNLHAVVLDPPRTGAGKDVIDAVARYSPTHVVHVGCDPATGARDLAAWQKWGYQLEKINVVDAFGLTHHVETLMYLKKDHQAENRK